MKTAIQRWKKAKEESIGHRERLIASFLEASEVVKRETGQDFQPSLFVNGIQLFRFGFACSACGLANYNGEGWAPLSPESHWKVNLSRLERLNESLSCIGTGEILAAWEKMQ